MSRFNINKIVFRVVAAFLVTGCAVMAAGQDPVPGRDHPVRSIVIDPGHGGYDGGAIGPEGITEKEVTLALARLTASELGARYRVLLTRTGDYQVAVADRIALANHNRADLFLSLHTGGGFSAQHSAVTVFFLDAAAEQGRSTAVFSGTDIAAGRPRVIWDEAHHGHNRRSKAFANLMEHSCRKVFGNCCRVKSDRMAVLQGVDMPAVMVEIGCLGNPFWEKQFKAPDRLAVMSKMICEAIDQFFQPDRPLAGDHHRW